MTFSANGTKSFKYEKVTKTIDKQNCFQKIEHSGLQSYGSFTKIEAAIFR